MTQTPPPKQALLARADIALFQCVVVDSKLQRRNIIVYLCGDNVFYASSMDGIFDNSRRRPAPEWLKKQIKQPPEYTQLFTCFGVRHGRTVRIPDADVDTLTEASEDDLVLDEDGVAQG